MQIDWGALNLFLDKWGFQGLLLLFLGVVTWRFVIPMYKERLKRADHIFDVQQAKLDASQTDYHARREISDKLFAASMASMVLAQTSATDRVVFALNTLDTSSAARDAVILSSVNEVAAQTKNLAANLERVSVSLEKIASQGARGPARRRARP